MVGAPTQVENEVAGLGVLPGDLLSHFVLGTGVVRQASPGDLLEDVTGQARAVESIGPGAAGAIGITNLLSAQGCDPFPEHRHVGDKALPGRELGNGGEVLEHAGHCRYLGVNRVQRYLGVDHGQGGRGRGRVVRSQCRGRWGHGQPGDQGGGKCRGG